MVSKQAAQAARQRAREAKARRDAKRLEHDKQVDEAVQAYYLAAGEMEEARQAVERANENRDAAVRALAALEDAETIATLIEIEEREVRAIKKNAPRRQPKPSAVPTPAAPAPVDEEAQATA